jgi:tRNA A37 threonylcarbamoyladenosine modification protein TsaB
MISMFIDTSNKYLIVMILMEEKIIFYKKINAFQKQNDLFFKLVNQALTKTSLSLSKIQKVYLIIGPGSFTGVKVGLAFVNTLSALIPKLKAYSLNSLF